MANVERFLLVATVKDEGPNILEWLAWHRLIGFTDFMIFENDSSDLTDRVLRTLDRAGLVTYLANSFRKGAVAPPFQNRAYRRAARHPLYAEATWCMTLDGDEFLWVGAPGGTVQGLVASVPDGTDEIRINWRVFGSSGLKQLDDRLVTERFVQAAAADQVRYRPVPVKTLFRTNSFRRPGIHLPHEPMIPVTSRVTGSGLPIPDEHVRGFQVIDPGGGTLAQVFHYMVRDAESFLMKSAKGSSSHQDRQISLTYWTRRNRAEDTETRLAARTAEIRAEMERVDALTGGRLLSLRARSLNLWHKRIKALKADPVYAGLYSALVAPHEGIRSGGEDRAEGN